MSGRGSGGRGRGRARGRGRPKKGHGVSDTDGRVFASRDGEEADVMAHTHMQLKLNSVSSQLAGVIEGLKTQLNILDAELKADKDGAKEYQDEMDKLNRRKADLQKRIKSNEGWCTKFDAQIGGVQEKYDHFLDDMDVLYDNAVLKHAKGLQQLYEDFNYHPLFKHYGDEFSAVPFKPLPKEQL